VIESELKIEAFDTSGNLIKSTSYSLSDSDFTDNIDEFYSYYVDGTIPQSFRIIELYYNDNIVSSEEANITINTTYNVNDTLILESSHNNIQSKVNRVLVKSIDEPVLLDYYIEEVDAQSIKVTLKITVK